MAPARAGRPAKECRRNQANATTTDAPTNPPPIPQTSPALLAARSDKTSAGPTEYVHSATAATTSQAATMMDQTSDLGRCCAGVASRAAIHTSISPTPAWTIDAPHITKGPSAVESLRTP